MDYYAQSNLGSLIDPDNIVSSNRDFEEELKLTKLVTEEFNNHRKNFSGDIVFDINEDSKALKNTCNHSSPQMSKLNILHYKLFTSSSTRQLMMRSTEM